MLLKAAHILTMGGAAPSAPFVRVLDGRIDSLGEEALRRARQAGESELDLGQAVLTPGFVNAHCHLELTALGPLSLPGSLRDFVAWIREVVRRKTALPADEMARGIRSGIRALLQSGVSAVGDHVSFDAPIEEILASPLRGVLFGEVLGVIPEVSRDIYRHFREMKNRLASQASRFTLRISPHSAHSIHPSALRDVLRGEEAPLSCHLAESAPEEELFRAKRGPLDRLIRERGQEPHAPAGSGLQSLVAEGLPVQKLLVVHGNYFTDADLKTVLNEGLSVVHCPGSHRYFGHKPFPLREYLDLGMNVALGTDSVASNAELDFLAELRLARAAHPHVPAGELLKMATVNGARALGMESEIGALAPGKAADIAGFRLESGQAPEEAPFQARRAEFLMIGGGVIFSSKSLPEAPPRAPAS